MGFVVLDEIPEFFVECRDFGSDFIYMYLFGTVLGGRPVFLFVFSMLGYQLLNLL